MRKMSIILSCLLLVTLISIAAIGPAEAGVQTPVYWVDQVFRGSDPFYGTNVNAYRNGSTAKVVFRLYNDYYIWPSYRTVNVSAVHVWFDWNQNFSLTYDPPLQINPQQTQVFTKSFTVPDTAIASNMFPHAWKIYVEHVNATTGPKKIVATWTYNPSYWPWGNDYYFAVYSQDQADATELLVELSAKITYAPSFNSYEAQNFWSKAQTERNIGQYMYHQYGDFASAKTHYQSGLDNFDLAIVAETAYDDARDRVYIEGQEANIAYDLARAREYNASAEATLMMANASVKQAEAAMITANASQTQADAALIIANATLNQSYAWILFGIGFIVISIGVLVYAYKKPKVTG